MDNPPSLLLSSINPTWSRTGVLNLFSPIPHILVGQLSISHHSIGLWQNRFEPMKCLVRKYFEAVVFEAVVLLSDRSFPTWQLRHSPPVGNSPQVKNHWSRMYGLLARVNHLLIIKYIVEYLGKRPAFLEQENQWNPRSSTHLPYQHFALWWVLASIRKVTALRCSGNWSTLATIFRKTHLQQFTQMQPFPRPLLTISFGLF